MRLLSAVDVVQLSQQVSDHGARITNLEGWQKAQNGAIHRVEAKVDRLIWWIMGVAVTQLLGLFGALILFMLKGGKI